LAQRAPRVSMEHRVQPVPQEQPGLQALRDQRDRPAPPGYRGPQVPWARPDHKVLPGPRENPGRKAR
jgi:hypothetical protein